MSGGTDPKAHILSPNEDPVARALTSLRHGYFADARAAMQAYAAKFKREARHYQIEGLAALAMADWPAAHELFLQATADFPEQSQFWFNRGLAEENLTQYSDAITSYRRSLALKPEQGEAYGNLSNIYRKTGRFPEAVQTACQALASGAPKAEALNVLGLALGKQGNFVEAQKAFDEAIALAPDDAAVHANLANLCVDQLKFDAAWEHFAEARSRDDSPTIRRDEGMARMLAGDYAKGLPLYEARLDLPMALRVRPDAPRWQGENPIGKTLLLVSEQGYGDTIQFCRYATALADKGANLVWTVRAPLQRLLAMNVPGHVMTEDGPLPACDYWLPILSLPMAFGMPNAQPPSHNNFRAPTLPRLPDAPGKRKIGLVWSGSPTHERDHERSIPLELLAPLLQKPDAQFYAPFKTAPARLPANIIGLDNLIGDFADTAALISQLDTLVTVDTAAAHLAGALNIKTYVLLPHCPDWRWGASGEVTGWYPNTTLLRQPAYGDWASVVKKLTEKLA